MESICLSAREEAKSGYESLGCIEHCWYICPYWWGMWHVLSFLLRSFALSCNLESCTDWSPFFYDITPRYVEGVFGFSFWEGILLPDGVVTHREWFVFCICGLSFLSSPQSITYHPHLDNSRSPPTNRSKSYHVEMDCSIALITISLSYWCKVLV